MRSLVHSQRGQAGLVKRKIPLESIGLDPSKVSLEGLEELAVKINEKLVNRLRKSLTRSEDYLISLKVSREGECINVSIDLSVESGEPITPEFNAFLDEVIDEALEIVRRELKRRFGKG